MRGVRVEPYRQDGRVLGYRIQSQSRSDLLDVISLQVGDVITEIDGRATQDPTSFFTAIERVADANRIRLTVLRGGEVQTIEAQLQ